MGDKITLTVEERKILGKKVKQLRKDGFVPAVVYGHGIEAQAVMAPAKIAEKVWHEAGKHHIVELSVGKGETRLAMIKSADLDPVKRRLRHLSLHIVKQDETVTTEVPVHIANEGETEAEKTGLVILQNIEQVEIEALPRNLPNFLVVDSSKLVLAEDHVSVADITPVDGVTILTDPSLTVATVYEPSALAAQNEALAGEATGVEEVVSEQGGEAEAGEGEATSGETSEAAPKDAEKKE